MAIKTRQLDFSGLYEQQSRLREERIRREEILANAITNLTGSIIETQAQKKQARRQKQVDIAEGMAFDTNLTADTIINTAIAEKWGEIRDSWVMEMQSKKGAVTPIDKAKLDIQKQAVIKMAQAGKNFVKIQDDMKKLGTSASKDLYEYDWDEVQRTLQDLANGDVDIEDFVMADFSKGYDSGMPFINIKALDTDQLDRIGMDAYKKSTIEKGDQITIESERGGKKYTSVGQEITFGDYEGWAEEMIAGINGRKSDSANYIKGITEDLSEQEKALAVEKYPQENVSGSFLEYYYKDKKRAEWEGELAPTGVGKRKVEPATKRGAGITFLFGGKKATEEGEISAQATKVEGVPFEQYIEFAKASPKLKMVKGVTVKGAQLLSGGDVSDAEDKTTPMDYEVIGYDKGEDVIFIRNKVLTKNGVTHYETYKAPRKDNEHFLKGLVSDETMQDLRKSEPKKKEATGLEAGFWE